MFEYNMIEIERTRADLKKELERANDAEGKEAVEGKIEAYEQRVQEVVDILQALFDSPNDPFALSDSGLDYQLLSSAAGPVIKKEANDKTGGLFRRHCVHCHGITGDGNGPTAKFLNPYPRDYRRGAFKFKKTTSGSRPTTDDLKRVLIDGIPGTSMPSFKTLNDSEIDVLVEYVKYLSMRGQIEYMLLGLAASDPTESLIVQQGATIGLSETVTDEIKLIFDDWKNAGQNIRDAGIRSEKLAGDGEVFAAAAARGRDLFFSTKGGCVDCHGDTALGDGRTFFVNPTEENEPDKAALAKENQVVHPGLPEQAMKPRNLRLGVFRFGRRPLDLYLRISGGIEGTPMPAISSELKSDDIWDLVSYVRSLRADSKRVTIKHEPENKANLK